MQHFVNVKIKMGLRNSEVLGDVKRELRLDNFISNVSASASAVNQWISPYAENEAFLPGESLIMK